MDIKTSTIFAYVFGIVILFILGRVFTMPVKFIARLILNLMLGSLALIAINYVGGGFGFHISLNFATALVAGFLGLPGVVLLVALKGVMGL